MQPRPKAVLPKAENFALKLQHEFKSGGEQTYLLISDCHWDAPECYLGLLHKHLKEARERNALIIDAGDFWEAISGRDDPRGSKGTVREEHCHVNYLDRLVDDAIEEFQPDLDLFAYMGTGNHEQAILVRKETDLTARFIEKANTIRKQRGIGPIHRAGYMGAIRFLFNCYGSRLSHNMLVDHGTGGNSPITKGTIAAQRRQATFHGFSLVLSGHIHQKFSLPEVVVRLNESTGRIEEHPMEHIQVGSYKRDFRTDGTATWHMMKSGKPKPIGGYWLTFRPAPGGKGIFWQTEKCHIDYPNITDYLAKPRVSRKAA